MAGQRSGQTVEFVYQSLRERIVDGTYGPGVRLSQLEIAGDLRVSRTPLREALQRLERERLVCSTANRGFIVAPANLADVENSYAIRLLVEPHALAAIVPDVSEDELGQMENALWKMTRESPSTKDFQYWHRKYHDVLLEKYSPVFTELTKSVITHIDRYQRVYFSRPLVLEDFTEVDRLFLDAVRRRDSVGARALLQFHLIDAALGVVCAGDPEHQFGPLIVATEGAGFAVSGMDGARCTGQLHITASSAHSRVLDGMATTNLRAASSATTGPFDDRRGPSMTIAGRGRERSHGQSQRAAVESECGTQ
ncbi:GntR family transcriptional regulator [Rhodococcus globerulus]|uniref:GntR family transcriptional regulator n=1 Tax=Rhodococcus globerulus TaxID=33008 RepID=UPI00068B7530|nr:GntR family transcriptional regulator [Rhodococcus globerulus]PVX59518.1 DNA-binding GntR family transcriptional regulator [Rhodococcus globerulus]